MDPILMGTTSALALLYTAYKVGGVHFVAKHQNKIDVCGTIFLLMFMSGTAAGGALALVGGGVLALTTHAIKTAYDKGYLDFMDTRPKQELLPPVAVQVAEVHAKDALRRVFGDRVPTPA